MYYIGVDLGGTNIAAGIIDECGNLLAKENCPTPLESSSEIIDAMVDICQKVASSADIDFTRVLGIGVACPGWVEPRTGVVVASANLPFKNTPLGSALWEALGKQVLVHNDANCAALAESRWGASKGCENSIMLTIGTGLGGGVIINGKLCEGAGDAVGELGHMVIVMDGEKCGCGLRGCCEAYTSASALIRQARRAAGANKDSLMYQLCKGNLDEINGQTPFLASEQGDKTAQNVVSAYINFLAYTITNYINIFRPEIIVIGGGVSNEGDSLFAPLGKRVLEISRQNVYGRDIPPIVKAKLGNDAGIYGAVALFTIL